MATKREAARMTVRQAIEAEPTVTVRIPRAPHRDEDGGEAAVQVQVNGAYQQIRRGDTVEMPVPLYLALKQTGRYDI